MYRMPNRKPRKAYTLVELVVVILILAILMGVSLGVGSKQMSKSRVQEATSFLQTLDSNIEEGIMDMGFLSTVDLSTNESDIIAWLRELEDIYLPCGIDYSSLTQITCGDYMGFGMDLTISVDPWKLPYRFYYMYNETDEVYRLSIASYGPNNTPCSSAANGYVDASSAADSWDDDIVMVMVSRLR